MTLKTTQAKVITGANLRSKPVILYNTIIGTLKANEVVYRVLTGKIDDQPDHTWQYVKSDRLGYGWIADELIQDIDSTIPAPNPVPTQPPSLPYAPAIPATQTRIGLHVGSQAPSDTLIAMAQRLYTAGKPMAIMTVITDWMLANRLSPYVDVMFRMVWGDSELYNNSKLDGMTIEQSAQYGRDLYNGAHHTINTAAYGAKWLKLVNERPFHATRGNSFWIAMMQEAEKEDRKLAIFGDSMSTPTIEDWQLRKPALAYAMKNGHAVTLNQYGPYSNNKPASIPVSTDLEYQWYGQHPFNLYASVPEDCRPLLILGETGSSDSMNKREYNVSIDAQNYDRKTRQYPYFKGFSYYTVGTWYGYPNACIDYAIPDFEKAVLNS